MSNSVVQYTEGPPRQMGKVITTVTITNRADQIRAESGVIPADQIRSVTLTDVLVDTGATMLCLPSKVIEQLGLTQGREVEIESATGYGTAHIYTDSHVSIEGREAMLDCLELPGGTTALLGVVPLELLGLEPDLKNERLRLLPDTGKETYLTVFAVNAV